MEENLEKSKEAWNSFNQDFVESGMWWKYGKNFYKMDSFALFKLGPQQHFLNIYI